jgi:hypothetical protein
MTPPKARFAIFPEREIAESPFGRRCVEAFLDFFFAMMKVPRGSYNGFSFLMSVGNLKGTKKERKKGMKLSREILE